MALLDLNRDDVRAAEARETLEAAPHKRSDRELQELAGGAYRYARHLGTGHEDAEDIAQDVAMLLAVGRTVISPWNWMAAVVRNRVYRLYRQTLKQPVRSTEALEHDPWRQTELWLDVRCALERLRPRARAALCMALAGHSEREIATALKCSVKAVEKTLHKNRRRLRGLGGR